MQTRTFRRNKKDGKETVRRQPGHTVTEEELRTLFSEHGEVLSLSIVRDRYSGRPRGFGLVEFANNENAQKAKHAFKGRALQVEDAREQRRGRGPSDYGRRSRY